MRSLAAGHSLIVVEHNLHVMAAADFIIDMGPGPAAAGGEIVVSGTPEQVAACPQSITGKFLAEHLAARSVREPSGVSRRAIGRTQATQCPRPHGHRLTGALLASRRSAIATFGTKNSFFEEYFLRNRRLLLDVQCADGRLRFQGVNLQRLGKECGGS